jgi:hypothetical protein
MTVQRDLQGFIERADAAEPALSFKVALSDAQTGERGFLVESKYQERQC